MFFFMKGGRGWGREGVLQMVSKLMYGDFFSLSFSFPKLYVLYLIKTVVTFLVTITKEFLKCILAVSVQTI